MKSILFESDYYSSLHDHGVPFNKSNLLMALYEICITGNPSREQLSEITQTLSANLAAQGKTLGNEVAWHELPKNFDPPDRSAATILFFGGGNHSTSAIDNARGRGIPILPVVSNLKAVSKEIPTSISSLNCLPYENGGERIATATLESLGLLPKQRRVFISYRRDESSTVALQLFNELSARQFDVFLDTHGVAPGEVFQDVLWHRLCDCDVLIMLDTHSYFESRWTAAEFGRALAKGICVLRVGWPGVSASARAKTATNIELEQADFDDTDLLVQEAITRLANQLERARSLGHAVRSVNMYSKIENSTKQIGGTVSSAGLGNSVEIALPGGSELLLVPAIGVPSAGTLQSAEALGDGTSVAVVYDQVGLLPTWQTHLEWLGTRIQTVKWIKASEIAWQLANWEETK